MRPWRRALLAGVLAAAGLPGCSLHSQVNKLCCRWHSTAPQLETTLPPTARGTLSPDIAGVGSPDEVDRALGLPRGESSYYELDEVTCQCRAVANSTQGNMLDAERENLRRKAGKHIGRADTMRLDILGTAALEARNESASEALQIYYGLAEGEARLDLARRGESELLADLGRARQLHDQGLKIPFDDSEFQRQLNSLRLTRIDLELLIATGNHELRQRLGLTAIDRRVRIWPVVDLRVVVAPIDAEVAVHEGLAMRPEIGLLWRIANNLDHSTLMVAAEMLKSVNGLLGMKDSCPLKGHKLLALLHHTSEIESRRRQVAQYAGRREQEVAENIRSAVDTIESRTRQVALAKATAESWQGRLRALEGKHTVGKASFPEIGAAHLKSVESQGEVIHAVANWKTSLVKLKAHQGRLVAECCGRTPIVSPIIEPLPATEATPIATPAASTVPSPPPELPYEIPQAANGMVRIVAGNGP